MQTIMNRLTGFLLLLLALSTVPAAAQTSLDTTTLSAAATANATIIYVTSATGYATGRIVYIDREAMQVTSVNSTAIRVQRGIDGTAAQAHASGAFAYVGYPVAYTKQTLSGNCTAANQTYTPTINTSTGAVYVCSSANSLWYDERNLVIVNCRALLIADMVDQSCFIADRPYVLVKMTEVHAVKEAGGTLTLIGRKNTGTQAPASGVALNTALDMAAAATVQTVRTATLTTTAADLLFVSGNRLSLDFTDDTAGELADVTVTFALSPR